MTHRMEKKKSFNSGRNKMNYRDKKIIGKYIKKA